MVTVENLLNLLDRLKFAARSNSLIGYCGLEPIPSEFKYDDTPRNTTTFVHTGGDGVHFSILKIKSDKETLEPVVMTVPGAPYETKNFVLAECIEEFLSLGYYNGWLALEQIAYNLEEAVLNYSKAAPELHTEQKIFIQLIMNEFNLQPISLSATRLQELRNKYFELLEIEK